MRIGVPKEIKKVTSIVSGSRRAASARRSRTGTRSSSSATPVSGIGNGRRRYRQAPARSVATTAGGVRAADMIVKVKEPQAAERRMLRKGQILFTYLHLAPDPEQTKELIESGAVVHRLRDRHAAMGGLPLLAPMCEVAGRMSVQAGAHYLEKAHGGRGMLLGGVPGVAPGEGRDRRRRRRHERVPHGARHGRRGTVLDSNNDVLRPLRRQFGSRCNTVYSTQDGDRTRTSPMRRPASIGGVLIPGASAPKLVSRDARRDEARARSSSTWRSTRAAASRPSHPTTHADPVYVVDGVRALLRRQHAGGGAAHVDVRAQQRHAAVRAGARRQGLEARDGRRRASATRAQCRLRQGHWSARRAAWP